MIFISWHPARLIQGASTKGVRALLALAMVISLITSAVIGQVPVAAAPGAVKGKGPTIVYKPKPEYPREARAVRAEGTVVLKIHLSDSGKVETVDVVEGLGFGLDESAEQAIRKTRFRPAEDASGHPVSWDGKVRITFNYLYLP